MDFVHKNLTTPLAIILGSLIIGFSIMAAGGVITFKSAKLGKNTAADVAGVANPQPTPEKIEIEPVSASDHIRGDKNARFALIEYSDLECPFCKRFHPTAQQVLDAYKGQLMWVYRHFPLDQLHSKARKEAEATECAGELASEEGFWQLADKIYEVTPSNNGLNLEDLPKLAAEVGIDQAKFKACLDSGKYKDRVEEDYQSGLSAGVQGTPGNILLDTKTGRTVVIPGAVPFDSLKQSIDSLIKSS